MFKWYKKAVFENYLNFKGRARRSEYWYFALLNILLAFGFYFIDTLLGINFDTNAGGPFYTVFFLGTLIPGIAVAVRRMHDLNKTGWSLFLIFFPFIGPIWLLFLLCSDGTKGENKYGPDPKSEGDEIDNIGTE